MTKHTLGRLSLIIFLLVTRKGHLEVSRPNGSFCFFSQAAAELHVKKKNKLRVLY